MSVEKRNIIDAIGTARDGHVILTIADQLPFNGDTTRLVVLQNKLNDCLDFIQSGEIFEAYPSTEGQALEISIRFLHCPNADGIAFPAVAKRVILEAGVLLTYVIGDNAAAGFSVDPSSPTI